MGGGDGLSEFGRAYHGSDEEREVLLAVGTCVACAGQFRVRLFGDLALELFEVLAGSARREGWMVD